MDGEIFDIIIKKAHGHLVFPSDSIRSPLRGGESKDVPLNE